MNILNLTVIAQLCVFYFYVLVSFQRQLRRERRRSRGTTIPLNFIDKQLRAVIHGSRSACESREFGSETESARSTVASLPGCNTNNGTSRFPEIYQFETACIGSFFVVLANMTKDEIALKGGTP